MRPLPILVLAIACVAVPAQASVCTEPPARPSPAQAASSRWRLDHYVYDASLGKDWEVFLDCNHPETPPRMVLAPVISTNGTTMRPVSPVKRFFAHSEAAPEIQLRVAPTTAPEIEAGAVVQVLNGPDAPTSIQLEGTAMQSAYRGQPIRVRLSANGRFVNGFVLGSHSVVLAAATKASWGQP